MWTWRARRLALQKRQRHLLIAIDHHEGGVRRRGSILGDVGRAGRFSLDDFKLGLDKRGQHGFQLRARVAGLTDQHDLHAAVAAISV